MTAAHYPLRGEFDTASAAFAAAAAQFGDREAYVERGARMTFANWLRRSDALAGLLAARGVRRGDVVLLMLPSSIDYAVAYGAVVRLGAVASGVNTRLGPYEVGAIVDRAQPALVIRDEGVDLPPTPGLPVLTRAEIGSAATDVGLDLPELDPAAPVVILWTSGTTGAPKGCWFDHRNLAACAAASGVMSAPYDRRLVATPFSHAGYMAKLWDQLAWGTTVVLGDTPWSAAGMAAVLRDKRITVAGGVPTQWAKLLELPDLPGAESVRIGVVATAPAPPDLVRATAARLGVPLVVRYAMSESPSIAGTDPGDPPEVQYATVGRPQHGMQVEVVGPDGAAAPPGTVGPVRVRGGCVMRGYWRDPERTAEALDADGWLTTGDLGSFDAAGNLVLSGRAGEMYIRGGFNVHPVEVENVLRAHPAVTDAAVVGAAAPVIGEIGVAFVVACAPAPPGELADWVRERLADYKVPDRIAYVPELPRTVAGKLDRRELERAAADGAGVATRGGTFLSPDAHQPFVENAHERS